MEWNHCTDCYDVSVEYDDYGYVSYFDECYRYHYHSYYYEFDNCYGSYDYDDDCDYDCD